MRAGSVDHILHGKVNYRKEIRRWTRLCGAGLIQASAYFNIT
jgi:hypothetical protein